MSAVDDLPAETGTRLAPHVKVDGAPLSDAWAAALTELRVQVGVRTVGRCTLRFADPGYALSSSPQLTLGDTVEVLAAPASGRGALVSVFVGTVRGVGVEHRGAGSSELKVVVEDVAASLALSTTAATYLEMSYDDIITEVVRRHADVSLTREGGAVQPYVLQADSDLAFVDELTRRAGMEWVVEGGSFHVWPNSSSSGAARPGGDDVELRLGSTLSDFQVQLTAGAPSSVRVRGWDPAAQQPIESVEASTGAAGSSPIGKRFGLAAVQGGEVLDAASVPADGAEASALARARLRASGSVLARGRGTVQPGLRPGGSVTVLDAGPSSGSYQLREVVHTYDGRGFLTQFVAGDRPASPVYDALAGAREPAGGSFTHVGLAVGRVTDTKDPEKHGRVRVQLLGLSATVESPWARVAAIGGGVDRGMVAVPEVGDEVLVGFESGDVRHPVVLGGLFGASDRSPQGTVDENGAVVSRRLTSRLGHVIELGDGQGADARHVLLELAGRKHSLRLGEDRAHLTVPDDVPLAISAGSATITLDGKGAITLDGTTVTVKARQKLALSGSSVEITATSDLKASGTTVDLKGSGTTTVQAGGQAVIKGAMVQIN
ncbi:phage baseplate assembly protein V [Cellulomonas chengniuliangii]|uniref:Phage baseplate assembly protein V n=1 Tax=Cellulomonas chengniuliangii TaxID=2968084 RepID=A0ABY5KUT4_9CELL|nr:phage baseplate assembly protein V [Cellulomonas chengniuliangii]MCC2308618.1 phage baseplate assembly protein V [Cellulomonas chengniuliangii]MCC2317635.1 phage baseplate assembly protein V [Cellulomonas chengniuliangii]UUI73979.1 phage baseplate assembly protein V [Cellulomonas chengniuliangii]